jgi:dehydratase
MTSGHRPVTGRIVVAGLLAVAASLLLAVPASAAARPVRYRCQATEFGHTTRMTVDQGVEGRAPATARAGSLVRVLVIPAPNRVPASVSGHQVNAIRDASLTVPLPTNADEVAAWFEGGSGLGGTPKLTRVGRNIVLTVPGPIAGGAGFQLPRLVLDLRAGRSGVIATRLGGTSYANAGLSFTADVQAGRMPVHLATSCYPDPSPVLTGTRIT